MKYIISSEPLHILQQFNIPKKDKYGNPDWDVFYNSNQGCEFLKISPLVISDIKDKKDLVSEIAMDISWISLCYTCDLYIYVMTDRWAIKNLSLRQHKYSNFGKCVKLQQEYVKTNSYNSVEVQNLKINPMITYFKGDLNKISEETKNIFMDVNLKENPIWGVKLSATYGFVKIE